MRTAKNLGVLLDLLLLAASIATGGQIADGIQRVVVLVAIVVAGAVIFCAVILTIALLAQRQPPYRIVP